MRKNILFLSDPHHGSYYGLTPPGKMRADPRAQPTLHRLEREMWSKFSAWAKRHGKADIVIHLGDNMDGKGLRDGGNERWTTSMFEQAEYAVETLKWLNPKKLFMVEGTDYHTTVEGENFEKVVAKELGVELNYNLLLEINGRLIDGRHFCARSSTAIGQFQPVGMERVLQFLEAERDNNHADIYVRGHVHRHCYCGEGGLGSPGGWVAMTLPGLQARGVKYGAKKCRGRTDWGVVWASIDSKGRVEWDILAERLQEEKRIVVKA